MRELTKKDVTFHVVCEPEDTPVRGNVMASGNAALDREAENEVLARLDAGDVWAWCSVRVEAVFMVGTAAYKGEACLGCCSYQSEEDFTALGGYYDDLCNEALADLNRVLRNTVEKTTALQAALT